MVREGYEFWGKEIPEFNEFWGFLTNLSQPDTSCPGCRQDGAHHSAPSESAPARRELSYASSARNTLAGESTLLRKVIRRSSQKEGGSKRLEWMPG